MNKISFATKPAKRKRQNPEFKNTHRYKRLIANTVKVMLQNESQVLTKEDYKNICLFTYGKCTKSDSVRIYKTLSSDVAKTDINSELQRILTDRGIKPLEKTVSLLQKGEELIKTTSDCISVAKMYKEISEIDQKQTTATETRTYTDFSKFKDAKEQGKEPEPDKITQKITVITPIIAKEQENEAIRGDISKDNNKGDDNV
jgi:hypothetical protein